MVTYSMPCHTYGMEVQENFRTDGKNKLTYNNYNYRSIGDYAPAKLVLNIQVFPFTESCPVSNYPKAPSRGPRGPSASSRHYLNHDIFPRGLLSFFTYYFPYRDPKLSPNSPPLCCPCQQLYDSVKTYKLWHRLLTDESRRIPIAPRAITVSYIYCRYLLADHIFISHRDAP
jgi:hypothetical protein